MNISDLTHSCVGLNGVCVAESVMEFNVPIKQAGKNICHQCFLLTRS